MEKKAFINRFSATLMVVVMLFILAISPVSALEFNPFADTKIVDEPITDTKDLIPDDFMKAELTDYPMIKISKTFLWVQTDKIAEYKITRVEHGVFDWRYEGKAVLYEDSKLFDGTIYKDLSGKELDKSSKYYIEVTDVTQEEIIDYKQSCILDKDSKNNSEICTTVEDGSHLEDKTNTHWKEYKFEELKAGEYRFASEGIKGRYEPIDVIPVGQGNSFDEWLWFNESFLYRRNISIDGGTGILTNFPVYINVTYDAEMQSDWEDIRFVNSTDTGALEYELDKKYDDNSAGYWVLIPTLNPGNKNTTIWMYWGNNQVGSIEDSTAVWIDAVGVYHFSEGSGTDVADSSVEGNDVTCDAGMVWGEGEFGFGGWLNSTDNHRCISDSNLTISGDETRTILYYTKFNNMLGYNYYFGQAIGSALEDWKMGHSDSVGGNWWLDYTSDQIITGTNHLDYTMMSGIHGASLTTLMDGKVIVGTDNPTLITTEVQFSIFSGGITNTEYTNNNIDELQIYDTEKSNDWINRSYDNFNVSTTSFGDIGASSVVPKVDLLIPADFTNSTVTVDDFEFNMTYNSADWINYTLYVWNKTNGDEKVKKVIINGTPDSDCAVDSSGDGWSIMSCVGQDINADGSYEWNTNTCNSANLCGWATNNFTLTIDSIDPVISNVNLNQSIIYTLGDGLLMNYTVADDNLESCWYNYNGTNTSMPCSNGDVNETTIITAVGETEIILYANDSFGHDATPVETNFTFDSTPPVIDVSSPRGMVNYFKPGNNETLNWSITETSLDSAWYEYNSTNTTIYGLVNNTNFTIETGDYELTLWANDTLGNLASNTSAWSYKVVENSQTYSNTTLEGNSETFLLNVTLNSSYVIDSANLNYNNTNYTATIGTNNLTATITIPSVASATNQTFYWIFILNEGSQIETNSLNQTVNNFGVDNCTTYTYQFLNMTMFDEDTQVMLNNTTQNTSIQVDFSISTSDNSLVVLNYSSDYYQTNPARICFESPLNSSVYRVDGVIQYDSVNRFQEFYNFQNYILNNATDNFTVGLYNLNDSNGEEFTITYKDANFVPVSNALVNIQRKYIDEGLFKTIEIPKTSASGTTIAHLITNDIIYNILVFKEGELLATFESVIADCQNPSLYSCEINLNSYGSSTMPTDFTEADDLTFTLEYNTNTREISSVFAIPSGVASEINLTVVLFDGLGNTSVCSDSLTSAGGGVSCAVPLSFGNSTVIATIHKDSNYIGRSIIRSKQNPSDIYGSSIIFIAMILFLLFLGIGASSDSPMLMGIIIILGTIVLIALNLVYSPSFIGVGATILWLVIAIVTVLVKGSNR